MLKKLIIVIALAATVFTGFWVAKTNRLADLFRNGSKTASETSPVNRELLPGPLRASVDAITSKALTRDGVVAQTNSQRATESLKPLKLNAKLNAAAEAKLSDMFAKQYFEHVSPDGKAPSDLIEGVGYEYIVTGENLALGNFKDNTALVQAWMNSPGHRANIMHANFTEIGVAVRKGTFEGKQVWLAVQEFGTPLSLCQQPSEYLKTSLDSGKIKLDQLEAELSSMRTRLVPENYSQYRDYEKAVDKYNEMVREYNSLAEATKAAVDRYNTQVQEFNVCLEANG